MAIFALMLDENIENLTYSAIFDWSTRCQSTWKLASQTGHLTFDRFHCEHSVRRVIFLMCLLMDWDLD